ncbi:hypothetical protein OCV67_01595, partial [Porcipelethomonas ammoniilytica]|uniref:hypothetical protein n=1 Tax=Porcipelethomonas ammoniilytica TaxID=2981722 RepID=UPI0015ADB2B9
DPILPAGFRTTADELVSESYCALYMMVEEWKAQGDAENLSNVILTVAWKNLGGGNYQLYIMWGGDYVSLKLNEYGFGENGKVSVDDF